MDYAFESLSPDTFQQVVQALLAKEHPDVQCFPVGQADAGRDATSHSSGPGGGYIVFQVKFTRFPSEVSDPAAWLINALVEEAPKVAELQRRGALKYIVITNVRGTATKDSGSIDKVSRHLTEKFPIPSICWWRDDLARRLDDAWDIKWCYPALLTGPDLLRAILQSGLSDDVERRNNAITATLAHQYSRDREVRFKQVELQNPLLDLFIDGPLQVPDVPDRRTTPTFFAYQRLFVRKFGGQRYFDPDEHKVGAATFLLSRIVQSEVPIVVLEGAPGQGKSTLTQYVCQVHRMHLLRKSDELKMLDEAHRDTSVRLPLRVDLRDYATWTGKQDPFSAEGTVTNWSKSLESFLAALIRYSSGGAEFSVSDLHAVAKISALLIVLDGLDEVADVRVRREVVDEIRGFVTRMGTLAASLQVIVTSRPAAFANSPGLRGAPFAPLILADLSKDLILQYGRKWATVRDLEEQDQKSLTAILESKLGQPHLRDLARNPMQLAILLSLIHSRGSSLPDKRTALYDAYMDLFFSREGEKSEIVRECRDLLIGVHRHVAWLIHAEAETGDSSGRMAEARLKEVIREYLVVDGYDPTVTDRLFVGVVERVVALVSRVQGTFEFEVQPLREYFAARYLYDTAPHSPVGSERSGSKPDRFAALSRNYYWLNVTRFYAGCYSKGELASLIDGLRELREEEPFRLLVYSQTLALNLLSDWVFSQHPRSAREVARLVFDQTGLRMLQSQRGGERLRVGDNAARLEMLELCWSRLVVESDLSAISWIAELMSNNSEAAETFERWKAEATKNPKQLRWIIVGYHLDHLHRLGEAEFADIVDLQSSEQCALAGSRIPHLRDVHPQIRTRLLDEIQHGAGDIFPARRSTLVGALARALEPAYYSQALRFRGPRSLAEQLKQNYDIRFLDLDSDIPVIQGLEALSGIVGLAKQLWDRPTVDWATTLAPWSELVEMARASLGDSWLLYRLAAASAGIRSTREVAADANELWASSIPLCSRARYARLRAGNPTWWKAQLRTMASGEERLFGLLLLFGWASVKTISVLLPNLEPIVADLSSREWKLLYFGIRNLTSTAERRDERSDHSLEKLPKLSERVAALIAARVGRQVAFDLYRKQISGTSEAAVLSIIGDLVVDRALSVGDISSEDLAFIKRAHAIGAWSEITSPQRWYSRSEPALDSKVAMQIAGASAEYPHALLGAAQDRIRADHRVKPVISVANAEEWFQQPPRFLPRS